MKKIIKLVLLLVFSCFSVVYAETSEIISTASVTQQKVTISGQILNVSDIHEVTLLVGSMEDRIYLDQKATQSNGAFEFVFRLPDNLPSGSYEYKIGSNANTAVHSGIIEYTAIVTEQRKFIEADVDVIISGYTPVISGTVYCTEGKTIGLIIKNLTDNTVLSNETITSEDGVFTLSHTLPSLLSTKEYEVNMVCSENNTELANLSAVIDSSILLVDISGTATTADNISINAQVQSVNTGLIDKSTTFTGNKSISATIPNLVSNASFHLFAEGYETVVVEQQPTERYSIYTFNGAANDEILLVAIGNNITTFEDRCYEITYDENKLMPIELYKSYFENALNGDKNGGVEIISNEKGNIKFRMVNAEIPSDKCWNGVMHIFKFKNILEEAITTDIQFKEI